MRILPLEPDTAKAITERMLRAGRAAAAPGTELLPVTAGRGVPYMATRAEAQIGGAVALEMLAEHHGRVNTAVIAAFGDPGLFGARELFDIPIIGMAEAAMLTACMLGRRFGIVTFARPRALVRRMRRDAPAGGAMLRHPYARRPVRGHLGCAGRKGSAVGRALQP